MQPHSMHARRWVTWWCGQRSARRKSLQRDEAFWRERAKEKERNVSNMEQKPEAGDASDATVPPVFADIRRAIEDIRNADKGRPEYCMYVSVRASICNYNSKVGD